jgi:hypothetical protein
LNELGQGLSLSGIGILVTFSALGILILLIVVLKVIFPVKHTEIDGNKSRDKVNDRESLKEQAAAVAVAALLEKQIGYRKRNLGSILEEPVGNWWQKGIVRSHTKERE